MTPQPHKRPRSSFIRFEAALPNELWQADTTHWRLADGTDVEILDFVDDHSRLCLAADAFRTVKALDVVRTFHAAADRHGLPAALLTDNGAVFNGGPRRGRVLLEAELDRLGIVAKHSTPNHPQTCGKVERFHQTLKRYLARQPPADSLADAPGPARCLPALLQRRAAAPGAGGPDRRSRRSIARIKARPVHRPAAAHFRVREDRVSKGGNVTVRYLSRLRHIGVGRAYTGERVKLLIADDQVRVVGPTDCCSGSSCSTPTATTSRAYTRPRCRETGVHDVLREDNGWRGRIRTFNPLIQSQVPYRLATRQRAGAGRRAGPSLPRVAGPLNNRPATKPGPRGRRGGRPPDAHPARQRWAPTGAWYSCGWSARSFSTVRCIVASACSTVSPFASAARFTVS